MKFIKAALVLAIACGSIAARAEVTIGLYKEMRKARPESPTGQQFIAYLGGLGAGISEITVMSEKLGGKPVYCAPGKFALGPEVIKSILDRELTKLGAMESTKFDKYHVTSPLVMALKEQYPCN